MGVEDMPRFFYVLSQRDEVFEIPHGQEGGCQQASESIPEPLAQQIERNDGAQTEQYGDDAPEKDEEGKVIDEQEAEIGQRIDVSGEECEAQGDRLEGEMDVERQGGIVEEMRVEIEDAGSGAPESVGLEDRGGLFKKIGQPALQVVGPRKQCEEQEKGDGQTVPPDEINLSGEPVLSSGHRQSRSVGRDRVLSERILTEPRQGFFSKISSLLGFLMPKVHCGHGCEIASPRS